MEKSEDWREKVNGPTTTWHGYEKNYGGTEKKQEEAREENEEEEGETRKKNGRKERHILGKVICCKELHLSS